MMLIKLQEAYRTPNRQAQKRIFPYYIIIQTLSTEQKKDTESSKRER